MTSPAQNTDPVDHPVSSIHDSIKDHMRFGAAGLLFGVLLAVVLINFGPAFIQASPYFAVLSIGLVFFLVGGMLAGLKALLPAYK